MSVGHEHPKNQGIKGTKTNEILPFLCGGFSKHLRRFVSQHDMAFVNKKCISLGVGITQVFQMIWEIPSTVLYDTKFFEAHFHGCIHN